MTTQHLSGEGAVEITMLVDTPEDYAIEEYAWVPVSMAEDEATALEVVWREFPVEEVFRYEVTGRSFQRPDEGVKTDYGWFIFDAEGHEDRDGRKGIELEFLTWQACKAHDPGAVEFWDLQLVEPEPTR